MIRFKEAAIKRTSTLIAIFVLCAFLPLAAGAEGLLSSDGEDLTMGFPMGPSTEGPDLGLCPQGVDTVGKFLYAWQRGEYRAMYDLIDDENKKDYPFDEARFDLQFMEFKEYKISSIRKAGDNYEFILSYGDWKSGDKDIKKMTISGRTYKIIMPAKHSVFKKSAESYF